MLVPDVYHRLVASAYIAVGVLLNADGSMRSSYHCNPVPSRRALFAL